MCTIIVNSMLEIRKLRHREVKWILQGHTAEKLG